MVGFLRLHDGWRIHDPFNCDDRYVIYHPLLLLLFFQFHPFSSLFDSLEFNILVILAWRVLMHARPCGVAAAILVSLVSSLVNARRCCMLVRFGSWQCCGYTSVDPEILYALVSGT